MQWRQDCDFQHHHHACAASRDKATCDAAAWLGAQEARYLQSIEQRQQQVQQSARARGPGRQLAAAATPVDWKLPSGAIVHVVTPSVARSVSMPLPLPLPTRFCCMSGSTM